MSHEQYMQLCNKVAESLFKVDSEIYSFAIKWADISEYRLFCYQKRAKAALLALGHIEPENQDQSHS